MNIVRSYADVLDSDRQLVGGKAWAAAKLAQANIPVPNGFCVTSALTSSMARNDTALEKEYTTYFNAVDSSGVPDQVLADRVKHKIDQLPIPPTVLSELSLALKKYIPLTSKKIIVRSSASIEDTTSASFAGQFASVITDNSSDALIGTIKKCWQVIVSPSLAAYAFAMKVRLSGISFAFLVQEFLDFDYSGVLFTRNPVKGNIGDYLVEYAEGGADQIVSGRVTPNRCLLKGGNEIVEWLNGSPRTARPPDEPLLRLGQLATEAKKLFQSEQDLEWGIIKGKVFLLQSRPITASAD